MEYGLGNVQRSKFDVQRSTPDLDMIGMVSKPPQSGL